MWTLTNGGPGPPRKEICARFTDKVLRFTLGVWTGGYPSTSYFRMHEELRSPLAMGSPSLQSRRYSEAL